MLVLSRHRDEAICIGDDIKIIVVEIRGDKVRLGIEAPVSVPVHRKEVYDAIKRNNAAFEAEQAAESETTAMPSGCNKLQDASGKEPDEAGHS